MSSGRPRPRRPAPAASVLGTGLSCGTFLEFCEIAFVLCHKHGQRSSLMTFCKIHFGSPAPAPNNGTASQAEPARRPRCSWERRSPFPRRAESLQSCAPGEHPRGGRCAGDSTRFRCQTPPCGSDAHRPAMLCSEQTRDQGSGGRRWRCDRMAPAQRRAWAREPGAWSVRGPVGAGSPAPEARRAGMPCTGGRDRPTRWGHRCPGDTGRGLAASVSSGTFTSVPCTRTSGCPPYLWAPCSLFEHPGAPRGPRGRRVPPEHVPRGAATGPAAPTWDEDMATW